MSVNLLLYSPKNFINLATVARSLEVFGHRHCYLFDPNQVWKNPSKGRLRKINKSSAGAIHHLHLQVVEEPLTFLRAYRGRKIASVLTEESLALDTFTFKDRDLILIGNEAHGLTEEILALCELQVKIPQVGITQSLNLSVATGIFLYEIARQSRIQSRTSSPLPS